MSSPLQSSTGIATIAGSIALARGLVIGDRLWLVLLGAVIAAVIAGGLYAVIHALHPRRRR